MRDKDLLPRKTKRSILVRAALTVRDQRVELLEEGFPHLPLNSFPLSLVWRPQSPAKDRLAAHLHPSHSRGRRQIARIGFHDQGIRIPVPEPIDQSALVTKIELAAQKMNVFPQMIIGNF